MNFIIQLIAVAAHTCTENKALMKRETVTSKRIEHGFQRAKCIKSEVIFGSPKNRCKGSGICKVLTLSAGRETKRPIAYITLEQHQKIRFDFVKETLTQETINQHFSDGKLTVTDRFLFPRPILRNWGLERLVIEPGFYEVSESQQFYTVCFI